MRSVAVTHPVAFGLLILALAHHEVAAQPVSPPVIPMPSHYGDPPRGTPVVSPPAGSVSIGGGAVAPVADDSQIRATAISLNYCRASFHRIRKYPIRPVLAEEQEKILNNLNLQGIEDPEVIALYTSVLDEINQIQVADRERHMTRSNFSNSLQRKMTWDLVAFSTDLATGQFGSAVKQGANSWWDYRGMEYQRDNDLMRVEKNRMESVTQKSSNFLDTFWKLARRKQIPDRWLVRGDDLEALETAQREPNPEIRLRILRRMEPYMQAYPPYWYYLARTEQELGSLVAAAETYTTLARIGDGHFRKDDMLATSLANLAAIQDHLGSGNAVLTASRALEYSPDVWEANLICARILEKNGRIAQAEDAILRNLDVALESERSLVFLASLYYHADDRSKLARLVSNPQVAANLPAPVLLRCAATLGPAQTPAPVMQAVLAGVDVQQRTQFTGEELQVRLSPAWQLHLARVEVAYRGQRLQPAPVERVADNFQLRYALPATAGPAGENAVSVRFVYPDDTHVEVALQSDLGGDSQRPTLGFLPIRTSAPRTPGGSSLKVSSVSVNNIRIAVTPANAADRPFRPSQDASLE